MLDEDYGDITDPTVGHDFKIHKVMDGGWPKYDQSQPRPKPSEAGTKQEFAVWMDSLHDIHGLVKLEEYEFAKEISESILPSTKGRSIPDTESGDNVSDDDYLSKLKS